MKVKQILLTSIPLLPASILLTQTLIQQNPCETLYQWISSCITQRFKLGQGYNSYEGLVETNDDANQGEEISHQLLAYLVISFIGYSATDRLIPVIKVSVEMYTLVVKKWQQESFLTPILLELYTTQRNIWKRFGKTWYQTRRQKYTRSTGNCTRCNLFNLFNACFGGICNFSSEKIIRFEFGIVVSVFYALFGVYR